MKLMFLVLHICMLLPCLAMQAKPSVPPANPPGPSVKPATHLKPTPHAKVALPPKAGALRIKPSEARSVAFVKYRDPSGYFTIDLPRGWVVKTGLKQSGKVDLISFAISVFDPKCPERGLYFCLNDAMGLQSVDARNWYVRSYGQKSYFSTMPVLPEMSSAGFFSAMGPQFGYGQFAVLERLGRTPLGGDIVVACSKSTRNGKAIQGLYHAVVVPTHSIVQKNPFQPRAGNLDVGVVTEYSIISETAPLEEFVEWQPVLDRCLSSIAFTESFHRQRRAAWGQLMGTTAYVMQTADAVRGMIMDSYRRRNATYDVLSQKRSDATLGYERVQDTETGEFYRAENGFTDWYHGTRYRPATENSAYLSPVSGYINWK